MRRYESIIVFHPHMNDGELAEQVESVKKLLLENGAVELEVTDWGKREVAYLTHKQKFGYYQRFTFKCDNHQFGETLNGMLRINEKVLKFQTHVLNDHPRKFKGNPIRLEKGPREGEFVEDADLY